MGRCSHFSDNIYYIYSLSYKVEPSFVEESSSNASSIISLQLARKRLDAITAVNLQKLDPIPSLS